MMGKKIEENMINSKCIVYERDENGERLYDKVVAQGVYLGVVRELATAQTSFGKQITSFDVALIKVINNGVKSLIKVPLEIVDFEK